jgi:phage gp36-like protein
MALYIAQTDLESALSPQTVLALFDDTNTGVVSSVALAAVLTRACANVDSFLARTFTGPFPIQGTPPALVVEAAIEFAKAFAFERHPDYVRTFGQNYNAASQYERALALMERVADALQQLPDWAANIKPKNVGAIVYSAGPRMIVDSPDGTSNGGDF